VLEKMMSTVIALELKNHEMKIGGIGVYGLWRFVKTNLGHWSLRALTFRKNKVERKGKRVNNALNTLVLTRAVISTRWLQTSTSSFVPISKCRTTAELLPCAYCTSGTVSILGMHRTFMILGPYPQKMRIRCHNGHGLKAWCVCMRP
jgi:hypothetical protein